MATGKRFYWMKLKESFMTSDTIDYFMSQPNGAQYVVLYQMLCLKTINTDGKLERQIGEVIIPYDISKIQRDTKWFSEDTIRVALQLYKSFGLIYEDQNGTLVMTDHRNLVGSETDYAIQKKNQRMTEEQRKLLPNVDKYKDITADNVHTDIRDRDKEIETTTTPTPSPSPDPDDEDLQLIAIEHSMILDAAEDAGFQKNNATREKLIDLYSDYGKDMVLKGISACVDQGKTTIAYLKGCLRSLKEESGKPDDQGMEEGFWGWNQ